MYLRLRVFSLLVMFGMIGISAFGQVGKVTGKVAGTTGETIPGANVFVVGSTIGTATDMDGNFVLDNVPVGETTISATFIGYNSQNQTITIKEGEEQSITFKLESASVLMDEVAVVGYGIQKKSDLTGSIASVEKEQLTQTGATDVNQAIQGRVAGVAVTANSGAPGDGFKVRIRGTGTINNSDPLYVVDGFPTKDIRYLTPNDIEKMEVLKDASAAAIYGSQGANGVIIITTKKGKVSVNGDGKMKPVWNFNAYYGVQTPQTQIDMLNATEYSTLRLEAYANDGSEVPTDIYERLSYVIDGGYKGTNWQDEVLTNAAMQNYSLSVLGGNESVKYQMSGTYFKQDGIVKNSGVENVYLKANTEVKFTKWLKGGLNSSLFNMKQSNYNGDLYEGVLPGALRADPVTPAWDVTTNNWGRADLSYINNPARIVDESKYAETKDFKSLNIVWAEAQIIEGLTFKSQYGFDYRSYNHKNYSPKFFVSTDEQRSQSSLYNKPANSIHWDWQNYLNYNLDIKEHSLNAMAGMESQYSNWQEIELTTYNVPEDEALQYPSSAESLDASFNSNQWEHSLLSYFARINYSFKDRYLLTATMRADGSSKFTEEHRWGYFPSFSAGWNMKKENFLSEQTWLTALKLRGGWGQVGNEGSVGNYAYVTTVTPGNYYTFGGVPVSGSIPTTLSNPEIQWEVSTSINIGIDAGLFDDRVSFIFDYYSRTTSDMLLQVPIPEYVGAFAPFVNAGEMKNSGIELTVGYRNSDHKLKYEIGANFSTIKNEVTSLAGGEPIESGNISKVGNTTRTEEGKELAYFYGVETDGIFNTQAELDAHVDSEGNAIQPNAAPGDVKFIDRNNDGKINEDDRTYLGSATPDFIYGGYVNLAYSGFDLKLFLQGSQGNEVVNGLTRFTNASNGWENSVADRMDRWTPENTSSDVPRMTDKDLNKNIETFSDRYVEDGSYFRLKNVQIGYTVPVKKKYVSNLRVYFSIDNALTFTKYKGFDPEIGDYYNNPLYSGIDIANYPTARTYMFGIQLSF